MKWLTTRAQPLGVMVALLLPILACSFSQGGIIQQADPIVGIAPQFTFTTFEGETYSLADFEGKVVVLNFWAGWCKPCREEAPELQSAWELYVAEEADVVFIGLASGDTEASSLGFISEYNITYLVAPDVNDDIGIDYNIVAIPSTYIIDKNGYISKFTSGLVSRLQLIMDIDAALSEETP